MTDTQTPGIDPTLAENRLDETFHNVLQKDLLPDELHPLVDTYTRWQEEAEDLQTELAGVPAALREAKKKDAAAVRVAVVGGHPMPTTSHQQDVLADIDLKEARFRAVQAEHKDAARALLRGMREHEPEISRRVHALTASAVDAYRELLESASREAKKAASDIANATALIGYVQELRAGRSKHLDFAAAVPPLLSIAPVVQELAAVTQDAEALLSESVPETIRVVGRNGLIQNVPNTHTTHALIKSGAVSPVTD